MVWWACVCLLFFFLCECVGVAVCVQGSSVYRSHFGSRYKLGCCVQAGFLFCVGSMPVLPNSEGASIPAFCV